jgi:hypothetical protein
VGEANSSSGSRGRWQAIQSMGVGL